MALKKKRGTGTFTEIREGDHFSHERIERKAIWFNGELIDLKFTRIIRKYATRNMKIMVRFYNGAGTTVEARNFGSLSVKLTHGFDFRELDPENLYEVMFQEAINALDAIQNYFDDYATMRAELLQEVSAERFYERIERKWTISADGKWKARIVRRYGVGELAVAIQIKTNTRKRDVESYACLHYEGDHFVCDSLVSYLVWDDPDYLELYPLFVVSDRDYRELTTSKVKVTRDENEIQRMPVNFRVVEQSEVNSELS